MKKAKLEVENDLLDRVHQNPDAPDLALILGNLSWINALFKTPNH